MKKITPDYIVGFVDGEGCFAFNSRIDRKYNKTQAGKKIREYIYWKAEFAIVLHPYDIGILEEIRDYFEIGSVTVKKKGDQARYSIQNPSELRKVIVPFFRENKLRTQKSKDFDLWSKAIEILARHRTERVAPGKPHPLPNESKRKLISIRTQMDKIKGRGAKK